ncbi:SDR family NAD(P)-dependent oxidoreductase [Draconibacterium sp. IB214405]|uniref:SDR family NAD(P)-dependent oxidoreductase n=1 Tax=Draconibacterium sp. IB214405 TaxID=3097352 RepID=UPI002A0B627D|nr:SDR family NAD(P)-dependent oxidoreductase [Draconibacterium sp. IB214405]MDX8340337.1 SDR family NAD(P)-dependent oxidoreductase [Draconibacterium sp. IB214405]
MFELKNKRIIITGASSGIGEQLCFELAKYDPNLILMARNIEALEQVRNDLISANPQLSEPIIISCDISSEAAVKNAIKQLSPEKATIDILINNAGIGIYGPIKNTVPQDFKQILDINFLGAVNLTYHTLPHFPENRPGMIVFVSSIAALYGMPCYSAYSASKAALRSFSQTLRAELGQSKISVLHVAPDYTQTRFFRNEKFLPGAHLRHDKMAKAEDVARQIVQQMRRNKTEVALSLRGKLIGKVAALSPGVVRAYFRRRAGKLLKI